MDNLLLMIWTYFFFSMVQVWSHHEYPLIPVGRMILNRNPVNYFAEVEQLAFDPSNMPPGNEASPDKMLQVTQWQISSRYAKHLTACKRHSVLLLQCSYLPALNLLCLCAGSTLLLPRHTSTPAGSQLPSDPRQLSLQGAGGQLPARRSNVHVRQPR